MSKPVVHLTIEPVLWVAIVAIALVFGFIFMLIGFFIAPLTTVIVTLLVLMGLAIAPFAWLLRIARRW